MEDERTYPNTEKINVNFNRCPINYPFNPHDALMHHFTYLKADLIFLQPMVLERKFS